MTGWTHYVSVVVAAVGVVQAVFLCLILRSEGSRAFGANRWMMLFIAAVALNLIEDVAEPLVSADMGGLLDLFFSPINFAIAPAVYLYFREISGNPSRRPWGHFILLFVVFNLTAWVVTHNGGGTVWAGQYTIAEFVDAFSWGTIFIQITIYIVLLWQVACRYLRKTEEQLGADRKAMQRWIGVVLGGLTFVFVTVAVSKIVELYLPDNAEMFGTEIAFALVLFAMSYEIATQPAVFVMADWPSDDANEAGDVQSQTVMSPDENAPVQTARTDHRAHDDTTPRPLLDPDGVERALARLEDIQARGIFFWTRWCPCRNWRVRLA